MNRPSSVAVAFGGPSPEHDVSILTGLVAAGELARRNRPGELRALYWAKSGAWFEVPLTSAPAAFLEGPPKGAKPLELRVGPDGGFFEAGRLGRRDHRVELDAVVVCCHGGPGEDGSLQGLFDLVGLPYTGPHAAGAALGMDKLASGAVVRAAGLPVLPRLLLTDTTEPDFAAPYIVKPRFGGSSIGIDVVADAAVARARLISNHHLRRGAVIEPYRPDLYDLQVAVRTWPAVELSAIERPIRRQAGAEILNYADKYVGAEGMHAAPRELPAAIPAELEKRLRDMALTAAAELGCRGINRIDFLSDGDELYLNELNTIPGSLSRHLFIDPPRSFGELLDDLLVEAVERPGAQFSSAGADGAILRSVGSIEGKLG